jgi:hypothetical protein
MPESKREKQIEEKRTPPIRNAATINGARVNIMCV